MKLRKIYDRRGDTIGFAMSASPKPDGEAIKLIRRELRTETISVQPSKGKDASEYPFVAFKGESPIEVED